MEREFIVKSTKFEKLPEWICKEQPIVKCVMVFPEIGLPKLSIDGFYKDNIFKRQGIKLSEVEIISMQFDMEKIETYLLESNEDFLN